VLTVDEVGILAGIESAGGRCEKCPEVAADLLGGVKVLRVAPLRTGKGVDSQIFRLHLHDFLEAWRVPVAIG